ncbi:glycosyltransferase family 4 protein [Lutibacter sp. B1]|uniref:glycosyltransferase family 4 protein n=1 Tax=Lutibacter sp. B1 TaxID=2725996 RepID=UPI001456F762|nr:glycosyltransferase [Lutibacter sp. B1]NLP58147.1 glycosyltransferase [Lutibacter sp. B1]
MKKILYIGNNFTKKSQYHSSMVTLTAILIDEGFSVICSSNKSNKLIRLLDMCFSIIRNKKKVDYILIDTFSTLNFYYALITSQLAKLFSIKYVPILHGGNLPLRLNKSAYFSKLIFSNSHINITPSKYLYEEFEEHGFSVNYIPNAISLNEYNFMVRENIHPKLLWVRAFDKTYNPLLAIKVLLLLKLEFNNISLCMVGPDKDGSLKKVKKMVNEFNLEKNIIFTGVLPKEQWHKLSKKYDIFINTTNIDNLPVSVIEAMALGMPVVSTNVGGLPFLIENNVDGILVEPNNETVFKDAIVNLIMNQSLTKKLSINARKKAETFDVKYVRQKWKDVLI